MNLSPSIVRHDAVVVLKSFILPLPEGLRVMTPGDKEFIEHTGYGIGDVVHSYLDDQLCNYSGCQDGLNVILEQCIDEVGLDHSNPVDQQHINAVHAYLQDRIDHIVETVRDYEPKLLCYGPPSSIREVQRLDYDSLLVTLAYGDDTVEMVSQNGQEAQQEKSQTSSETVSEDQRLES